MSLRYLRMLFIAALVVAAGFVSVTTDFMNEQVASHFGGNGHADAFMSRNGYRLFMLVFAIGLPAAVVALISGLPRLFPDFINLPNRDYWLAPGQREQTLDFLSRHALLLRLLLVIFICCVQWLVVLAYTQNPPQLANGPFVVALLGFLLATGLWITVLMRRFRRVP